MSWGERSCSKESAPKNEYGGCAVAKMETCNVDCPYYTWDGKTEPDSKPRVDLEQERIRNQKHKVAKKAGMFPKKSTRCNNFTPKKKKRKKR